MWALIAWLALLAGFAGISAFGINHLNDTPITTTSSVSNINSKRIGTLPNISVGQVDIPADTVAFLVAISAVVGLVLSLLYFFLIQRFAGKMIKASLVVSILVTLAFAGYFAYLGQIIATIIWILFAALYAWCYWSWRFRIPFAKVMLKTITSITRLYPATIVVGVVGVLIQFAFCAWWIVTLVGISRATASGALSSGASYALYVYTLFVFYWTTQVIGNVVHITTCGLFATFYFRGVAQPSGDVHVPVSNPTAAALKRALTTSLGPNCFGSLLIAIIQTLKALANQARSSNGNDNFACTLIMVPVLSNLVLYRLHSRYYPRSLGILYKIRIRSSSHLRKGLLFRYGVSN